MQINFLKENEMDNFILHDSSFQIDLLKMICDVEEPFLLLHLVSVCAGVAIGELKHLTTNRPIHHCCLEFSAKIKT